MDPEAPDDPSPVWVALLSTVGLALAIVVCGLVLLCGACGLGS